MTRPAGVPFASWPLPFSSAQLGTSSTTFYLTPHASSNNNAAATEYFHRMHRRGVLVRWYLKSRQVAANNTLHTLVLRLNQVDVVSFSKAGDDAAWLYDAAIWVPFAAGDLLSMRVDKANTVSGGVRDVESTLTAVAA